MKPGEFMKAAFLAASAATCPSCSVDEDCSLDSSDPQAIVVSDTLLSETQCIESITEACQSRTHAVCAATYDDYTSGTEKKVLRCDNSAAIEEMCGSYDVLSCNATDHPETSTLVCDGEVRE